MPRSLSLKTAGKSVAGIIKIAGVTAVALLAAQGMEGPAVPAVQQVPIFRSAVDLLQLDVSVQDANGRPVRGLSAGDFALTEDGVAQTIDVVSEVNVPDAESGSTWLRDVAPDVRNNTAEDGRLILFLLDDALTSAEALKSTLTMTVKRAMHYVIDQLGPTDLAAVLFTWQNKRDAQDFTTNHTLLHRAVDKFLAKQFAAGGAGSAAAASTVVLPVQHKPGEPFGYDWAQIAAASANSAIHYLIDLPARRKALIYVTPLLPSRQFDRLADGTFPVSVATIPRNLHMNAAIDNALRARVTVYGIDPNGLKALSRSDGDDVLADMTGAAGTAAAQRRAPPRSMAADTGGFVISSPAQFEAGVRQILSETGSYYLLGYRSSNGSKSTIYHTIDVRVARPGVQVRTHPGYVTVKPPQTPKDVPALAASVAGVLPMADLPLRVSAAAFPIPGRAQARLAIVLDVAEPPVPARMLDRLDLLVRAFTPHGDPRGTVEQHLDVRVPASQGASSDVEWLSSLDLKPGHYELRVGARSARLDKTGSAYLDVEVPDITKAPVTLSGVVLTSAPAPPAEPPGALTSFLPVVPTTMRTFAPTDRVSAFVRVYQGGRRPMVSITVRVQILDRAGAAALDRTDALAPSRFGPARSADYQVDLPIRSFPTGPYLLRIEATLGTVSTRRDVRLTVR